MKTYFTTVVLEKIPNNVYSRREEKDISSATSTTSGEATRPKDENLHPPHRKEESCLAHSEALTTVH